ncbi:MAG: agmatinase [Smithellaceae bacterium]|nr:agmatinase [Smithellaceae bacterium]
MTFGGIEAQFTDLAKSAFSVLPVPYDLTSTYQPGARRGPVAIIEASANMELNDEELKKEIYLAGIHTADTVEADARGPEHMVEAIRVRVAEILDARRIPVVLGGEHSISFGAVKAMVDAYPTLSVLHLDAHADLRDSYQGSPYSHACVARRISEICPIVQVGIRSLSVDEARFLEGSAIPSFSADFIFENHDWTDQVAAHLKGDIYITIDLDVFDPAIMPSTGTPEPGGLFWRQVLGLVRKVSRKCRVRGFDVVELSPLPGIVAPDFLAAKLIYRLMGYLTEKKYKS